MRTVSEDCELGDTIDDMENECEKTSRRVQNTRKFSHAEKRTIGKRPKSICVWVYVENNQTCRRPWRLPCPPPLRPLLSLLFPLAHPSLPSFHLHLPLNPILFSLLSLLGRCPRLFSLSARSRTFLTIRPQTTSHFPSEFQFCCDPHENIDHQVLHFSPSAASVLISVTIDAQL